MKKVYLAILGVTISLAVFSQTSYYINDNSTTGDVYTSAVGNDLNAGTPAAPFATLNKAISVATNGSVIYVDAGTYTAGGLINKSLTIRGANYLISPNDAADPLLANGSRNAETIISNASLDIGASNINISGMTFDPLTNFAIKQPINTLDFDNINISKNIFRNKSDNRSIQIFGKFQMPLVTFDCFITDNRFIKEVSTGGTTIIIAGINNVQVLNNTFTVSTVDAIRRQNAMNFGTYRMDNLIVSNNIVYRQNVMVNSINSKKAKIEFNKAVENNRFVVAGNVLTDPCEIDIVDNIVTDSKNAGPSISYIRNNGGDINTPNIARIERNTITVNATGTTNNVPQALISANLDNATLNCQVYIRDNTLKISGDFGAQTDPGFYVSGIRFLGNSRQAVVENNDIEFTGVNNGTDNKFGIGVLHSGLQPDAIFNFTGNKISGFPASIGIQNQANGNYGELPIGLTMNINNNSFTGDMMSINNGANSQTVNASCNWYGSAAAQNFINKLSLSTLDIMPWLTNGTDNNAAMGFQPVGGSCDGYATFINLDGYTDVTCNGANNGTINITATYGKAPNVFTWTKDGDPGFISHDEDPTNLSPGVYHLALVDGNGSNIYITDPEADGPGTIDVTITEPSILDATASGTDVDCNGNSTGTASVTVTGGTASYSYLWSNGATTSSISNLAAGIHSITVTDANGCTAYSEYEVTEPEILVASASGTNVDCYGNSTGSASVDVTGGTEPYSYLWSNGETTSSISNLAADTYSVTVTDANGCTAQSAYLVTEPAELSATAIGTSTTCANTATVNAGDGTAPYTYLWSNGATSQTITSIPAGTYSVTVTDAHGCTTSTSCTVTAGEAFNPSASVVDVNCFGGSNGSISVTNINATAPFQFSIDGVNFGSPVPTLPFTFSNLAAGTYTITVMDANGCTGFVTKTITQPPLLTAILNTVQSTCFGQSTGSISVTTAGGSGALSYSWTGPNEFTATSKNISNLAIGGYLLTVTDNNGCAAYLEVVVPSFNQIDVIAIVTNIMCKGDISGSIYLTVSGGPGSVFSYLWNNGATTRDRTNLGVANYSVTITDIGSGCMVTRSYSITQPASAVNISASKTNVTGCASLGTVTATGSGGASPYYYSLDGIKYQHSGSFTDLYAGSYTVWVKDWNGCIKTSALLSITDNGTDEYESNNSKNQSKSISIGTAIMARIALATDVADWFKFTTGAAGNYTLSFSPPTAVSYTFNMYPAGNNAPALIPVSTTSISKTYNLSGNTIYYISVTGGLSYICYQLSINAPAVTKSNAELYTENPTKPVPDALKVFVYPNPHQGSFTIAIESPENGMATVELFNSTGQKITERKVSVTKGEGNKVRFTNIRNAALIYRLQAGNQIVNGKIMGPN